MTLISTTLPTLTNVRKDTDRTALKVLCALIAVLALQMPLVFRRAVNWDEFWHYSQTVLLAQGRLSEPLQTLYTRAFFWVPSLAGTGVEHIILIRVFMLGCELAVLFAIVGIATRFADRTVGLLCALAYLSSSYVFQHGTSFRFDPPAAALLMSALWVLSCKPFNDRWLALAGVLVGISTLLTMKSILYAPAFAGILLLRLKNAGSKRDRVYRVGVFALAAAIAFVAAYLLHSSSLAGDTGQSAETVASRSANKMFIFGIPPYWRMAVRAAIFSPVQALLILAVPFVLWRDRRDGYERLALLGLWLPIATLIFYHNTAPYYHVFMLAPVAVSLSVVLSSLIGRFGPTIIAITFLALAILTFAREKESPIQAQRELLVNADRIFGKPVAYFDSCAMIGQFQKANAFLTPWGIEQYLAGGYPAMSDTVMAQVVPLVIDDDLMFHQALRETGPVPALLKRDVEMLRSTYVHFWGPFWVAGFNFPPSSQNSAFEVRVPGKYTLTTGNLALKIDGVARNSGDVVELERGSHAVSGSPMAATLLWGDHLKKPDQPAPSEPYFTQF